jgi:hypothetical protein
MIQETSPITPVAEFIVPKMGEKPGQKSIKVYQKQNFVEELASIYVQQNQM